MCAIIVTIHFVAGLITCSLELMPTTRKTCCVRSERPEEIETDLGDTQSVFLEGQNTGGTKGVLGQKEYSVRFFPNRLHRNKTDTEPILVELRMQVLADWEACERGQQYLAESLGSKRALAFHAYYNSWILHHWHICIGPEAEYQNCVTLACCYPVESNTKSREILKQMYGSIKISGHNCDLENEYVEQCLQPDSLRQAVFIIKSIEEDTWRGSLFPQI